MADPKLTQSQKTFLEKCSGAQPTFAVSRYKPLQALLALKYVTLSNPKVADYYVLTDEGRRALHALEVARVLKRSLLKETSRARGLLPTTRIRG